MQYANAPEDLLVLSADGSEMRRLTSDLAKDRAPIWDPTGRRLAFYSTRSGRWEGWVIGTDGSDLRHLAPGAPVIGSRLGPCEITAKLGEGGMGEVCRATDARLKREVAIKVQPGAFTEDPE